MTETTIKQRALEAVRELPDTATLEDIMDRLLFLAKIERGVAQADAGQLIPHEQIKARFGL